MISLLEMKLQDSDMDGVPELFVPSKTYPGREYVFVFDVQGNASLQMEISAFE